MKKSNEIDYLSKLGLQIKLERTKKKLSQESLAHKSNLDRNYIGKVERGEQNPTILTILKITNALDISLLDLFENLEKLEV